MPSLSSTMPKKTGAWCWRSTPKSLSIKPWLSIVNHQTPNVVVNDDPCMDALMLLWQQLEIQPQSSFVCIAFIIWLHGMLYFQPIYTFFYTQNAKWAGHPQGIWSFLFPPIPHFDYGNAVTDDNQDYLYLHFKSTTWCIFLSGSTTEKGWEPLLLLWGRWRKLWCIQTCSSFTKLFHRLLGSSRRRFCCRRRS